MRKYALCQTQRVQVWTLYAQFEIPYCHGKHSEDTDNKLEESYGCH